MFDLLKRRSIRKYDGTFKISNDEMLKIIADAQRAPSSQNLQPIRFIVVESADGKNRLKSCFTKNLSQLETSSAMICLFGDLNRYQWAEKIYSKAVDEGLMPKEVKQTQLQSFANHKPWQNQLLNKKTIYIDGGIMANQLMHVARLHGYETCAIGGFDDTKINEALDVEPNLIPIMIVSIGKPAEDGYPSIRLDVNDVTSFR